MDIIVWVLLGVGLISFAAAISNWDLFYMSPRQQQIDRLVGRKGSRIIYALIGALCTGWALTRILWLADII